MLSGGQWAVAGELYRVEAAVLAALDELEGHPQLFRRGPVRLDPRRAGFSLAASPGTAGRPAASGHPAPRLALAYLFPRRLARGRPRLAPASPGAPLDWLADGHAESSAP
jgi:hypothetical protein